MASRNGIQGEKQLLAWWAEAKRLPEARRTRVIAGSRGLYARLHASGAKQWLYRYQFSGKARVMVLGRYPDTTLAEARKVAASNRAELDQGIDPAAVKRARIAAQEAERMARDNTVGGVAKDWMEREFAGHRSAVTQRRAVINHICEPLGGRPVADLTHTQVSAWLADRVAKAGPAAAQRALRHLRGIYRYAMAQQLVVSDPTLGLRPRDAGGTLQARDRVLGDSELTALFRAMARSERFARENAIAVELLLLICARKMELLGVADRRDGAKSGSA